ncbi:MAG: YesU family protein [Defluviitaleaceae bacterium]|nr:YesU family protein [Defluviitaleaceae bacterium]
MFNLNYAYTTADFTVPVYKNALASAADTKHFILEGTAKVDFPNGKMQLSSVLDPELGQAANYVYWCDQEFPSDALIEWEFTPLAESGLCIMFFSATNLTGGSVFDANPRTGRYEQYYNGDINAFHVSYNRTNAVRDVPKAEGLRLCNLRKSKGFHMAAQGGDVIPELSLIRPPYPPFLVSIVKRGPLVAFYIEKILCFFYHDDGVTHGPLLGGGRVGFRQMSPMVGEYANLNVRTLR